MAAAAHRRHGDAIARLEIVARLAAAHHLPGEFVAEHAKPRQAEGLRILGHVQVGTANAAGGDADQHLVGGGLRLLDVVDHQRQADRIEKSRFHRLSSTRMRRVGNQGASTLLQISPQMPPRANSAMNRVSRPRTTR